MTEIDKKEKAMSDQMLIDLLEGDLNAEFSRDMDLFVKSSPLLQARKEKLAQIRSLLKDIREPLESRAESEDILGDLHDRIMSDVSESRMRSKIWLRATDTRNLRYLVGVLVMIAGTWLSKSWVIKPPPHTSDTRSATLNKMMIETTVQNPEALENSILMHEDEIELFMDVAAEKMKAQTERENAQLLKTLKE